MIVPLRNTHFEAVRHMLAANDLNADDLTPGVMAGFLGVCEDDTLLATACLQSFGADALLRSLATDPAHRGRGHAKALVQALETKAVEQGMRRIYLLTDTAADFFTNLGYRDEDRSLAPVAIAGSAQFSQLCPASASFMMKAL